MKANNRNSQSISGTGVPNGLIYRPGFATNMLNMQEAEKSQHRVANYENQFN